MDVNKPFVCGICGKELGEFQDCDCTPKDVFLTHHERQDFSQGVCGCVLERREDGEGSNFRMCPMHKAAPDLLDGLREAVADIADTVNYDKDEATRQRVNRLEVLIKKAEAKP